MQIVSTDTDCFEREILKFSLRCCRMGIRIFVFFLLIIGFISILKNKFTEQILSIQQLMTSEIQLHILS